MNATAVYIGGADRDYVGDAAFKLANQLLDEISIFSSSIGHADIVKALAITTAMCEAIADASTELPMVLPVEHIDTKPLSRP